MQKNKLLFRCSKCLSEFAKWQGQCSLCQEWNTIEEHYPQQQAQIHSSSKPALLHNLAEISDQAAQRYQTGIAEWDNTLGGGIVPGSLVIIAGEPGVGKSTLLLQAAQALDLQQLKVIYFATEESLSQVKSRCSRLNIMQNSILFSTDSNIDTIIATLEKNKPHILIIDSIQNCRNASGATSSHGGQSFLRHAAQEIMQTAKQHNVATIMSGHITKDGSMAGPKTLEHLVDAVFYLQSDPLSNYKVLKAVKNRFGAIDEIGFFSMTAQGFNQVSDINREILKDIKPQAGLVLSMIKRGMRALVVQVQSLCVPSKLPTPQRVISGIDTKRVLIILAVLEKFLKVRLSSQDIFLKTSETIAEDDRLIDLAIALSILSSYSKQNFAHTLLALGEISLTGSLCDNPAMPELVSAAAKNGLTNQVVANKDKGQAGAPHQALSHIYQVLSLFTLQDKE